MALLCTKDTRSRIDRTIYFTYTFPAARLSCASGKDIGGLGVHLPSASVEFLLFGGWGFERQLAYDCDFQPGTFLINSDGEAGLGSSCMDLRVGEAGLWSPEDSANAHQLVIVLKKGCVPLRAFQRIRLILKVPVPSLLHDH